MQDRPQPVREAHPDTGLDTGQDQVVEQLKAALKDELKNDIKAELREELKAEFEAEHKAETNSIRAENQELRQKVDALETKLEAGQQERPSLADRPSDASDRAEPSKTPDVTRPGERSDVPVPARGEDDAADQADMGAIDRRGGADSGMEEHKTEPVMRQLFTAENVTAAGAGVAFGQTVIDAFHALPPEVGIGAAGVALVGALMDTKIREVIDKIWRKG